MKNYLLGLMTGPSIAVGASAWASAIGVYGGPGYMTGWDVILNGDTVCHDPYAWTATREIECD